MNTATQPVAPFEPDCYSQTERHAQVLACKDSIDPEVVLVGDSITHFWGGDPVTTGAPRNGLESFEKTFGDLRVLNLGYGYDRTQNVLWRFENGELDGLHPKLAIVNIGTNNLPGSDHCPANSPEETCEGIEKVCETLEARCPGVKIIIMCIFPRGEHADDPLRAPIERTNALIIPMAARHGWRTINIGSLLLDPAGDLSASLALDFTHPTGEGYKIWGSVVRPLVRAAVGH